MQSFEIQNNSKFNLVSDNISLNSRQYSSEQNVNFSFVNALSALRDVKVNNFSSLFLTTRQNTSDIFAPNFVVGSELVNFSTTIYFNAIPTPLYWVVDETNFNTSNTSNLYLSTINTANGNYFDVVFTNNFTCKITHTYQNNTRYLTVDSNNNLLLANDTGTDFLGAESPQIFYYVYDSINGIIALFKRISGVSTYISVVNQSLTIQTVGINQSIPSNSLLYIQKNTTNNKLPESFDAHYIPDFKANTIQIAPQLSRNNIPKSLVLHSEIDNNTNTNLNVNFLNLKDSQTPQNVPASVDNFIQTDAYTYRDYEKIISGTHQETGDYNLSLSYDSYATQLTFKADKITFFHIPYDIYPYSQLNINDTNLIYKGAIAGSHPLQSDKIFKKKADYKYSSSFGQSRDENNGQYLCTWLSAGGLLSPTWVDRYYNPQSISRQQALSSIEPVPVFFADSFSNTAQAQPVIFDKISDLTFEKGGLYAYHHLGNTDLSKYIAVLSGTLIGTMDTTTFDGGTYVNIPDITPIYTSNQFTIAFDMYNSDWTQSFANQILGTYIQNGFGIFNQNTISPFVYNWIGNQLFVYNTDLELLQIEPFEANIQGMFRRENAQDYYLILQNNKIIQVSTDQTEKFAASTNIINFNTLVYTLNTANSGFFIIKDQNQQKLLGFNFNTYSITDLTSASNVQTLCSLPVNQISTIDYYNGILYCTNQILTQRQNNNIYYIENGNSITRWDVNQGISTVYPFLSASGSIQHFNIDKDGNLWVLYNTKITKLTNSKQVLFTQTLAPTAYAPDGTLISYTNINVDFTSELVNGKFQYNTIITSQDLVANTITLTKLDSTGNILSQLYNNKITQPLHNINTTNGAYSRREISSIYPASNLNAIITLQDSLNNSNFITLNNILPPLSSIDAGYHNFCIKLDCAGGVFSTFIDGINIVTSTFQKNRYYLNNNLQKNMYVGAIPFYSGLVLSEYTKQSNSFNMGGVTIKNLSIYNKALPDSDISVIGNINKDSNDIIFEIYTGKRSFIDEIDMFYKMSTPGFVSNFYNINIKNTGITDPTLQSIFNSRFKSRLNEIMPGYTDLNNINWT